MKALPKLLFTALLLALAAALLSACNIKFDGGKNEPPDGTPTEDEIIECDGYKLTVKDTVLKDISFTHHGTAVRVVIPEGITEVSPEAGRRLLTAVSLTIPTTLEKFGYAVYIDTFGMPESFGIGVPTPKLTEIYDLSPHFDFDLENARYSTRLNYNLKAIHNSLDAPSILTEKDGFMFCHTEDETFLIGMTEAKSNLTLPVSYDEKTPYTLAWFAFANCNFIKSVTIPEGITTISTCAFSGCRGVEQINLPSTLKTIDAEAFSKNISLKEIVFPEGVERIEAYSFYRCSQLYKITFPASLTYIGEDAFRDCNPKEPELIWNYTGDWKVTHADKKTETLTREHFDNVKKLALDYVFAGYSHCTIEKLPPYSED
ncbi:MAG: leucine-rich repeat domain-containing protein [Clostridia bacterium]|nr:leucine-rich repeat domain-containing protein [Clostridia bacterium]